MNPGQPPRLDDDDPFSAAADPCPPRAALPQQPHALAESGDCACRHLSRRTLLTAAGTLPLLLALPLPAQAETLRIPCVQREQIPQPCRHRYCRHYGGSDDIHGR
jgi:hypothetical protein